MGEREDGLMGTLNEKAVKMLGWLNVISYEDGSIPLLNDSANGIAPTTKQLNDYADRLHITHPPIYPSTHLLKESGYRKIVKSNYECIIDIGNIGPDYIPGHAHADTFNFELRIDGKPFIVDTGLSTYETNARRMTERGTAAHNTVEVSATDSSEVWGGFRVAERAYVTKAEESSERIVASHNGYRKKFGITHTRAWHFAEDKIIIKDALEPKGDGIARLHFHPDITEAMIREHITIHKSQITMQSRRNEDNHESLITNYELPITNYNYAPEFNKTQKALVMEIPFENQLNVEIKI
ncbi:MAG: heparinase II/III-family protein [Gammaproteobacteria bacterium]|nr:heparinase II/III-family protein [Gammaproteobacteria bacterium]MBD3825002.1 heparinase II/III-family protein [Campylobacterota bacterium]